MRMNENSIEKHIHMYGLHYIKPIVFNKKNSHKTMISLHCTLSLLLTFQFVWKSYLNTWKAHQTPTSAQAQLKKKPRNFLTVNLKIIREKVSPRLRNYLSIITLIIVLLVSFLIALRLLLLIKHNQRNRLINKQTTKPFWKKLSLYLVLAITDNSLIQFYENVKRK